MSQNECCRPCYQQRLRKIPSVTGCWGVSLLRLSARSATITTPNATFRRLDVQREPMPTELIWDGKYDKDGRKVAPLRIALPFQTVETVNESAQERQRTLDLFKIGRDPDWRN